jgi:hypothetical protein
MILSRSNVTHYLLDQGLLSPESVVDGDLIVADASRRNRNFKVIRRAHQGYFVKQINMWDPLTVSALATEATCYRLAREVPDFGALAEIVPRDFLYDTQRHVLVTELLPEAESLSDHHRRLNAFPPEVGRLVGEQFGRLHREPRPSLDGRPEAVAFRRQPPWALSTYQQGTNMFGPMSGGNAKLLEIVRSYPDFQRTLEEIRKDWRTDGLMHGDVKWDNCVVYPDPSANGKLASKIVDWELSDIGDPCWDVGALLQSYIAFWVFSMRVTTDVPVAQLANTAQYPIENMQPSVRAFWQAYVGTRGLDRQNAETLLVRSMRYGAARMIQTAYESMQYSPQIMSNALCLLQVSFNILREPRDAVTHLLGL